MAGLGLGGLAAPGGLVAWQQVARRRDPAGSARSLVQGRRAFAAHRADCHGQRMEGRALAGGIAAPPLRKPGFRFFFALLPAAMEDWVRAQIYDGSPPMPAFGPLLDAGTLDALAFHLRTVNTGAAAP